MTRPVLAGLGIVLVAILLIAFVLQRPITVDGVTIRFMFQSEAESLLKTLGLPEAASQVSGLTVMGPDGNMPIIATRSFYIHGTDQDLRPLYRQRCAAAGLKPPDTDDLRREPDMLCIDREFSRSRSFHLRTDCDGPGCRVFTTAVSLD